MHISDTIINIILLLEIILIIIGLTFKQTILYRTIDGVKTEYLIRYTIVSCKWFTIKIHKALISDPNDPHDHPWNYTSIILWGGYAEERILSWRKLTNKMITKNNLEYTFSYDQSLDKYRVRRWYKPLSIIHRKGNQLHRLIIPEGKYCISLIFTSKKWRLWGYIRNGIWE